MDKAQAWHSFISSFGWNSYDANTVPDDAQLPRITYEVATDNIGNTVFLSASLWDLSTSWDDVDAKADEIAKFIGYGGTTIKFDEGLIWITQGSPFSQRMADENPAMRRILLNFAVEFLSAA